MKRKIINVLLALVLVLGFSLVTATPALAVDTQATPTFSPVAGAIAFGTTVTISSADADAIYYTTDGSDPTISSTDRLPTSPIPNATVPARGLAVKAGLNDSAIGSAAYTQAAATAPSDIVLAAGSAAPVGGVTNVAIPAAGATDTTGAVTGWITATHDKIKFTVTDAGGTSTITINTVAYTSGADYTIAAAAPLTIVVTTTEAGKVTGVRTFTVSVAAAATQAAGGGGGGGFGSQLVGIGLSGTSPFMDGNGRAITAGLVSTQDGSLSLSVPVGTYVWNAAGAAQSFLSATPLADPPAPPAQNSLVLAFEMGPNGVTFNPAISLIIRYTDAQIPPGTVEADLYIAWWDGTKWVKLTGTVDATANTVAVQVSHFTSFGLFAPPAPPPPPAPTLSISSPATGASFDPGSVSLSITVGNLKLVHGDNLPKVPGEGCIVYYLDVNIPTTPGQSAFSAAGTFTESIETSNAWANLAPGTHTLGVQLVQNDHTPFNPPVYSSVSVTIKEPPAQTTAAPIQTTQPTTDTPDFSWLLIVSAVLAALALGVFIFWKSRKTVDKLQYTNRK